MSENGNLLTVPESARMLGITLTGLLALPPEERDRILAASMATFAQDFADDDVRDFDALDIDS